MGITLVDVHLTFLNWFYFLIPEGVLLVILVVLIDCMILLSPFLDVTRMFYKDVYVTSFFPSTARPWNSLLIECFLLIYDVTKWLKSRICRHFICRFFLNRFHVCFNLFVFFFLVEAFNLAWTME